VGFPETRQRLALCVTCLSVKRGRRFDQGGTVRHDSVGVLRAHWRSLTPPAHNAFKRPGPKEPLLDQTIESDRQGTAGKDGAVVGRGVPPGRFTLGTELYGVEAECTHEA
jgi:hypothetical protein